ncbi:type 3 dihydrofolate reductase [Pantoea sp. Mhis]|uniref:type 3 dihydrofolate reductase n=1 Tax=Pantoea sp. Mhis TaxID=2576759 RepID=UPI001356A845|nr:type 3 dihydrofolate reductase [Pantoea sp. Mhis]MXP56476.1 type 3 dihydrofolate reductase [Pantoea sp. Mhis]
MISLIAALSMQSVIGIRNTIPWRLPADLAWFKHNTINKPVIMGRMTFESIGRRPLPERINIVVTNHVQHYINAVSGVIWVSSLYHAIKAAFSVGNFKEIMVIGGGSIYEKMIIYADRLYLTHIEVNIEGDVFFPKYKLKEWKVVFNESYDHDINNPYRYRFEILERKIIPNK